MIDLEKIPEYNAYKCMIEEVGLKGFFEKFQGFDNEVTLQFAKGFDGKITQIGNFVMAVNEKTIARATGFPLEGEKWFKNKVIDKQLALQFLKQTHHSQVDSIRGVPRSWFKDQWCNILFIIQKYLTCEGRYSITFLYHVRLLLHFSQG